MSETAQAAARTPEAEAIDRLWSDYKSSGSKPLRDQLIVHYSPLVKYVAGRLGAGLPQTVEQADLIQGGMFGLMDAIEKFDPGREVKFETYAIPRVRGAILDGLRAMDWVPRSVRTKARELEKTQAELEGELKRAPTDDEVAGRLGIDVPELNETLRQISFVSVMALDEVVSAGEEGGDQRSLLDTLADARTLDPMAQVEGQEMLAMLADSVGKLSEREQFVVRLYYYEGMTLAEIGEILGVTESRVCQIHTKAVGSLRKSLAHE